ncbi:MAG: NAD-dependent epimerase/dehydratase family protein, partial [Thermoguttaceae bacterium]|nr:NAD-dependent epimerase/dehydratase family protein [Thermoguttaceae bacterium]
MNSRKVLVTGATGLIGTKLVEKLLARGYAVRGMGRRPKPEYPKGCT